MHIEQHDVRQKLLSKRHGLLRRTALADHLKITLILQRAHDTRPQHRMIIHHRNPKGSQT